MKVKYTIELTIKDGFCIPIDKELLNNNFPIKESTCGFSNWKDILGSKQGGINTISVDTIAAMSVPKNRFLGHSIAFFVTWTNKDTTVVISEVSENVIY